MSKFTKDQLRKISDLFESQYPTSPTGMNGIGIGKDCLVAYFVNDQSTNLIPDEFMGVSIQKEVIGEISVETV